MEIPQSNSIFDGFNELSVDTSVSFLLIPSCAAAISKLLPLLRVTELVARRIKLQMSLLLPQLTWGTHVPSFNLTDGIDFRVLAIFVAIQYDWCGDILVRKHDQPHFLSFFSFARQRRPSEVLYSGAEWMMY